MRSGPHHRVPETALGHALLPWSDTETNLLAEVGLTPRAAKVVTQLAAEVARREGHDYVGTEHLLVALIEERKGLASQVLYQQGVAQSVLDATLSVIRSPDVQRRQ